MKKPFNTYKKHMQYRPTAKQLLQHPFIKRTKNNSILAKLVKKRKRKFSAHADTLNDMDDDSSSTEDDQECDALIENVMNDFESLFAEYSD
uniref:Uncharacterized protein n=1 Tax=Romanomermis culicivorax TaxID=13658 RepID=A0A915KMN0_ROMCU